MRMLALLVLLAALAGCASSPPLPSPAAASRDLDHDRVLVTMRTVASASTAALSVTGRLDYQPPAAEAIRRIQLARAAQIAAALDLTLEEEWPIPALDVHCFVFRIRDGRERDDVMRRIAERDDVEAVQPLHFFETESSVGERDPLADWNGALSTALRKLHANATGRDVTVAVIDAGVDIAHEDLAGAPVTAVDLVDGLAATPAEAHGTAVVGVLSARPDNGIGIRGFAPDARVLLIRACWETDANGETAVCNSFTLARAMTLALEAGADVVNMSIRGPRDALLERLGAALIERNSVLVAGGTDSDSFPASVSGSVVAARDSIVHDPRGMLTLLPGNRYGIRTGTSITTARLSGLAALFRQLEPGMSGAAFLDRLRDHAADMGALVGRRSPPAPR